MKHHTNSEKSARLQPVLNRLLDGKPHSNLELRQLNNSSALHSDIADLRTDGYIITCTYGGLSENRRRIQNYQLIGKTSEGKMIICGEALSLWNKFSQNQMAIANAQV